MPERRYAPEVRTTSSKQPTPKVPPGYVVVDTQTFTGGDVNNTDGDVEKRVNKSKRPGRTIAIGSILVGAIIVGGCNALPDQDRKELSPYPVTSGILPTGNRAPSPDATNPRPTGTQSPEAVYPQLRTLPAPTDIPALEKLCLTNPMDPAKTAKTENGTLIVRIDTRCMGGDPKKESTAEVPAYRSPNDVQSQSFSVKTGQLANILCIEDGPRVSASNGGNSEAWARVDVYASDGAYKGRASIPDAATGFAVSNPMNGEFIPACGNNQKTYFP